MRMSSDEQAGAARTRREAALSRAEEVLRVPKDQWPAGERWCAGCQTFVPLFYVSGSRCKACTSMANHGRRLEETYGISSTEYDRLLRLQDGRCAICRNRPRTIRLATDHDHQTGAVRGLLCKRCNHDLLGGGHDSIDMLFRALTYLLFPPAARVAPPNQGMVFAALREHLALKALLAPRPPEEKPPPF
jgi:hypothetical protein